MVQGQRSVNGQAGRQPYSFLQWLPHYKDLCVYFGGEGEFVLTSCRFIDWTIVHNYFLVQAKRVFKLSLDIKFRPPIYSAKNIGRVRFLNIVGCCLKL